MRASRLALIGLFLAPSLAALAQVPVEPRPAAPAPAPAPALPGLAARRPPAPIPADPNANLSPNAALFDAVNRGDLAAARDAVARGANLEARNALGLTALDAAVDQGRNAIAFYLLSARDLSRGPAPSAAPASLGGPPPAARPEPRRATAAAPAAPALPRNARLWANDGGSPRPEIGFLGFDAGRPARGPGRS
jgi:ankyrin repeat protein